MYLLILAIIIIIIIIEFIIIKMITFKGKKKNDYFYNTIYMNGILKRFVIIIFIFKV